MQLTQETSTTALRLAAERRARIARMAQAAQKARVARMIREAPKPKPKPEPAPAEIVPPADPIFFKITPAILRPVRIIFIQKAVCAHFGIKHNELLKQRRFAEVVYPRQVAMHAAKKYARASLPEIGRRFGGYDHTSVLHSYRKIERLICEDTRVAADVADIARAIGEVV